MHKAILRKEIENGDIIRDFFLCKISEVKSIQRIIRGWASTPHIDRYGDRINPEAFRGGIGIYMKNPILLLNHDPDKPIGKILKLEIKDQGLYIEALIAKKDKDEKIDFTWADYAWSLIKRGILNGLSVCTHKDIKSKSLNGEREIIYWDLAEISVVTIPANPHAIIESFKEISVKEAK